jgi:hypothetical protein
VPDEGRLTQLVKSIRDGVVDANFELNRVFYRGARFLIQRRLGCRDVDSHVQPLLDSVGRRIRADNSIDGRNLPGLVRQMLVESVPGSTERNIPKSGADRPAATIAREILEAMSPIERDALRRCYVQGEPPEAFLNNLRMTPDQFRALRLRARTEFSTRTNQTNVA